MGNTTYIISNMWNSISGVDTRLHFRFNIICGVAVKVRGLQKKSGNFVIGEGGGGQNCCWVGGQFFRTSSFFSSS